MLKNWSKDRLKALAVCALVVAGPLLDWLGLGPGHGHVQVQAQFLNFLLPIVAGGLMGLLNKPKGGGYPAPPPGYNPWAPQTTTGHNTSSSSNSSFGENSSISDLLSSFRNRSSSVSNPFITPEYKNLGTMLRTMAEQRMMGGHALPPGYEATGLRKINEASAAASQGLKNRLTESGLAGSPVEAAANAAIEQGRAAQSADFRANLPLLERQMANEDAQMAQGILGEFGKGQSTTGESSGEQRSQQSTYGQQRMTGTGTSTSDSTQTGPPTQLPPNYFQDPGFAGSAGGSILGGILPMLMMMYGRGMFGGAPGSSGGASSGIPSQVWT